MGKEGEAADDGPAATVANNENKLNFLIKNTEPACLLNAHPTSDYIDDTSLKLIFSTWERNQIAVQTGLRKKVLEEILFCSITRYYNLPLMSINIVCFSLH